MNPSNFHINDSKLFYLTFSNQLLDEDLCWILVVKVEEAIKLMMVHKVLYLDEVIEY